MFNVLYVDDEQINLDLFEISFMKYFKVHKSISGKQGLEILNNNPVDVVVSDLKMPEMDGIEFIRKVKEFDQNINCILLTGYYEENIINNPDMESLIYKYVMKPFKMDELKSLIADAGK